MDNIINSARIFSRRLSLNELPYRGQGAKGVYHHTQEENSGAEIEVRIFSSKRDCVAVDSCGVHSDIHRRLEPQPLKLFSPFV
jgi:hypothetical protein